MTMADASRIRNFCIVAHINHGKSTLADRLLEHTGLVTPREMREQVLDAMDLERERGITIKASAVRIPYRAQDGHDYVLNLIDTPGHVDFSYEVSRSLAACEGALLVVDAAQGVEAQTVANALLAVASDLLIIPVINKIDLRSASAERVRGELEDMVGVDAHDAVLTSAKDGTGTTEVLEAIVQRIPPPAGDEEAPLRALIFDSHFDPYRGIIAYVRVREGRLRPGMRIRFMATGGEFEVDEVGVFKMRMEATQELAAGEVGYVAAGVKNIGDARVGDTITDARTPAPEPLPGYREAKPMVFCGIYPTEGTDYHPLRDALEKLQLNDPALHFEAESSAALGFGFRCGYLGLLHMEIVQERLEREYGLELIATSPSVVYRVTTTDGKVAEIDNPSAMPETQRTQEMEEPYIAATIMAPGDYVGPCLELCQERRGIQKSIDYSHTGRVIMTYELPLSEILFDFFDQLKSRTRGYASFDYDLIGYRPADLARMSILINGQPVDALSFITHRERAYRRGKALVERLRRLLPRQMFEVRIQAALDGRIIASETIKALRKNVIAKCYGGDITRKRKLLEKQKAGKRRMKQIGNVNIPQEAFMSVLKIEE
jgi:GTP-binding protein LepA